MTKLRTKKSKKLASTKKNLKAKKTLLPKGQNLTDVNFKVKKIIVSDQINLQKKGEILNKKNLSCQELIGRLTHHNVSLKRDALAGLKELLLQYSKELIQPNLAILIESLCKLLLNASSSIRKEANKLLSVVLSQVSLNQVAPLFELLCSYLICGLTHIDHSIKEDSLHLLDTLLKHTPELCAKSASKLLPVCLDLVSSSNVGSRTLSLNLESKLTSGKWRVNVLARISLLLFTYLKTSNDKHNNSVINKSTNKKTIQVTENDLKNEKYYISLVDQNFNYNYDENRILCMPSLHLTDSTEEFSLKEFAESLVPLLFEAFIELVPVENKFISNNTCTNISSEISLLLNNISQIIHTLWNLGSSSNSSFDNQKWMKIKFGKLFLNSLIDNRYPYSSIVSMEVAKQKNISRNTNLPSDYAQNILLGKLLIALTPPTHWKPAIAYFKNCLRMCETFSVDECSLLISSFHQICCGSSENTEDFIAALLRLNNSKNTYLSSLAFNALYIIAIDANLTHLHNNNIFISWFNSLPEKLTKSSITSKTVEAICELARRNFPSFSTSLDGSIEVILDNLVSMKINGLPEGEGQLKVAQLLFWVKDWDSEMVEALKKGVKNNYWGTSVTTQIRDILKIKGQW